MDTAINEIVMRFADAVSQRHKTKAIYLYGSQAKGVADKYSDIDIAVVVEPINDTEKYMKVASDLFSIAADFEANIEPNLLEDDGEYNRFSFLAEVMETGLRVQ